MENWEENEKDLIKIVERFLKAKKFKFLRLENIWDALNVESVCDVNDEIDEV